MNPAEDVVAEEEAGQVVGEAAAGAGVVDACLAGLCVPADGAVGGPEVADEVGDLLLGEREDPGRDELLMTAQTEQAEVVEPGGDRVALAAGQSVRRGEAEGGDPRGGVLVTDRGDAEAALSSLADRGQVRL